MRRPRTRQRWRQPRDVRVHRLRYAQYVVYVYGRAAAERCNMVPQCQASMLRRAISRYYADAVAANARLCLPIARSACQP